MRRIEVKEDAARLAGNWFRKPGEWKRSGFNSSIFRQKQGVAQSGRVLALEARGRGFKSHPPDQKWSVA